LCFHLREDTHKECIFTDALEMHFIDMVKFNRLQNRDIVQNPLHRWLTFLNKHTNPEILRRLSLWIRQYKKQTQRFVAY
jgi:hypothetical protein